jgi:hypothetical protein
LEKQLAVAISQGKLPTMLPSHQFASNRDAEEQLQHFYEEYKKSLKHLYE